MKNHLRFCLLIAVTAAIGTAMAHDTRATIIVVSDNYQVEQPAPVVLTAAGGDLAGFELHLFKSFNHDLVALHAEVLCLSEWHLFSLPTPYQYRSVKPDQVYSYTIRPPPHRRY